MPVRLGLAPQQAGRIQFPPATNFSQPGTRASQRLLPMNVTTIVLINGLWVTALSWELWIKHYTDKGYRVVAANWPGMEGDIEQLRRSPGAVAKLGLTDVIDHYERIIREIETPPIIIGHGLGGLVTQILLDRGWGATGVAIASAPPKGVFQSLLGNFKLALKGGSLTPQEFHHDFANTFGEAASIAGYERYAIPAPNRILRQVAFANLNSNAASTVRFHNDSRAPLLLVAGDKDRMAPSSVVKANFDSYRESKAETDYKEYPDQTHFSLLREMNIADYVLGWALCRANGSKLTASPNHTDSWSVQLSA